MKEEEKGFRSGFVSIIGRPNVGKSTLLNRILGQKIAITADKPQTTRNRILGIHNVPGAQVLFLDTPGIHRGKGKLNRFMVEQAMTACSGVDAVLFLVEATDTLGGGDEFILSMLEKGKVPVVLVINKIDLIPRPKLLPLIEAYAKRYDFKAIIPLSGLTGERVEDMVEAIIPLLPEGPRYYPDDMVTDLPERFIVAEMIREQVLRRIRQEIPYGVAVQVETFTEKPEKNLVVIEAVLHVEQDRHKGILLGKGGATIRSISQAARIEIEKFLGTRVFLEVFIRVDRNWTESARMLKEFGYH